MKQLISFPKTLILLLFLAVIPQQNWAQVSLPYSQNFEGSTSEWTLQSSSPNKWVVGTAAKNGGSKGLYISNDNGSSNAYTDSPNGNGYSQTYASFQVNLTGVTNAELKFDWRAKGEQYFDYGDVWINTGGSDILISSMDTTVNDPQQYGEFCSYDPFTYINSNPSNVFVNKTISLTSYVGGIVTIKFRWRNDDSTVNNPPFAIDNVQINAIAAPVIAPTIAWQSIGSLTATSATITSNISNAGTNSITARGLVYGTSPNPTTADNVVTSGSGTGVYSINLTGLNFQTHYYFRSYCTTSAGTYYGSQGDFYTNNIEAPVARSASSIGLSGFTANWDSVTYATGYKLDVSTSPTVFTNFVAQSSFVTFDFENGRQISVNPNLSNSNNSGTYFNTSNGVLNYANELGNGGEVKKVTGWNDGVGSKYYRIDFNSQGMYNMKLSSKQRSTSNGPKNFKIQYSLGQNGSENWIDISGGTIVCADNFTTGAVSNIVLPTEMENLSVVSLRWVVTSTTAVDGSTLTSAGENNIDDVIIKGSSAQTLVSGYDNLSVSGTSKVITGLDAPVTYYYRVRAVTSTTTSANSNVITAATVCTPSAQATSYVFGTDTSAPASKITFSFQAAVPAATGYVVVRYAHGATPTAPTDGTTYTIGSSLGTGTVVYAGTNTSGTATGLSANTEYDFYTYAYNSSSGCTMIYKASSPLSGSYKTCVVVPTLSTSSAITNTGFTANWNAVSGATSYSIHIYTNSNFTQQLSGSPFTSNTNSYSATGLSPSTTYYFKVKAIGPNSCDSGLSSSGSVTLLCTPLTQPFTYQLQTDSSSPSTIINFSYQPTTIASTGYLTVVYLHGASPTPPVSGTSYSAGDSLGSGTVAYSGSNYYSSISNLTPNTEYDFYTYAFNTTQVCTKEYNLVSPLFGSFSTCVTVPTSSSASLITNTGFTANWSAVTGATNYTLEVFSDSGLNTYVPGSPFSVNTNSYAVTGLTNSSTYYYRVSANGAAYCNSGTSSLQGPISLECNPSTSLAATALATATTINSISAEFTAAASNAPDSYLVVRTTTNTQPVPVNGTTYTVGSNSIGFIEYVNTIAGSWTSTGLTANTTYYYWVFSAISTNCFNAPVYSTSTTSFSEKANATATWTGAVSSSWNTGGNWSTGAVPTSTDNIVIDSNASNSTVLDTNFTLATGQKLTLSGTGTLTINPTSRLTIAGYADFGGKPVTFKSTSAGTATLGQITGTLTRATNVTIERYIPAKRAWRAITAPLKGWNYSSVYSSWMNNNQSGVSDATGMLVFGPTTNWGIQMAQNYNLLTYNANDTWSGVSMPIASGTLFSSTINNAFMAFITGPFGSSNITSGATATTLKAKGELITGTQTYSSLSASEYKFIGNPYASPISPSAILTDNANFSNIWVWDPELGSLGAYVVYSGSAYSNTSGSYSSNQPIQSGQAFFVKPNTTSNFIINESHKSTTVDNGLFAKSKVSTKSLQAPSVLLRVNLLKQLENKWKPFDAVMALFDANASNAIDAKDAVKMFNPNNNITIQNNGISLMAEHRALPTPQDALQLRLSDIDSGSEYKLAIQTEDFSTLGLSVNLVDLVTNTTVPISLNGTITEYNFVPSATQNATDRFKIVFGAPLSIDTIASNDITVFPNPLTGSSYQIHFENIPFGNYRFAILNTLGQVVDHGKINLTNTLNKTLTPNIILQNGIYILKLVDEQNKNYSVKLLIEQ
jgi:hypothetical protein